MTIEISSISPCRYRVSDNEDVYWRSNSKGASKKLLIRLRAEYDSNMSPPKGWKKRDPDTKAPLRRERRLNNPVHLNRMRLLQDLAADQFGVLASDISGLSRKNVHVEPRMIAIYVAREFTNLSLPKIGSFFGGRDHSTILSAFRKVKRNILIDPDLAFDVALLVESFTGIQQ